MIYANHFSPDASQQQLDNALRDLAQACSHALSPHEPSVNSGSIASLHIEDYQGRLWATRARPWVDRLASAWLNKPEDCP